MAKVSIQELKTKSATDLRDFLLKERQRLRDLYFRLSGAQLKNVQEIKETKRTIAKILTLLQENKKIRK